MCHAGPRTARADTGDRVARVTLSLRQATLIQSMSAAACFAMGGIDPGRLGAQAMEHADTYSTTLTALRDGHEWMGLESTQEPRDLTAIAVSAAEWRGYRPAIDQIIAGDLHSVVMRQIIRDTGPTVAAANHLSSHFLHTLELPGAATELRAAAQLAAHSRMLTQRALVEMCFVLFDIGGAGMRARLVGTMDEITDSFARLGAGDPQIAEPPTARVSRNLRTAQLFWSKMAPTINATTSDTPPDALAVQKMLKLNRSVLKQLDQAVAGYVS